MKRITRRIQSLNERAAELTAAANQLPSRVAELRQTMDATTGELQNLKTGIQVNVPDLLVKREEDLTAALTEVAAHAPVFAEAGFILDGIDMEISPVQQIIVQLVHFESVDSLTIQPLIQRHQQLKYVRAILSAILKAKKMAEAVDIDGLDYHKLTIAIGPAPTIRLCWRDRSTDVEAQDSPAPGHDTETPAKPREKDLLSDSSTPSSNFFGPPSSLSKSTSPARDQPSPETTKPAPATTETPPQAATQPPVAEQPAASPPKQPPPPPAAATKPDQKLDPNDPLARFKVMPPLKH